VRWPFVPRRAYDDLYTRYQQALEAAEKSRAERDSFRAAAQTSARQFVEADTAAKRLEGRVKELSRRIEHGVDSSEGPYVAQLERRVERLARTVGKLRSQAPNLARQIDQAKGLISELRERLAATQERARKAEALLESHALVHGERPIEGGSRRPQPPGELLQSRAHARALDRRLAEVTAANQQCTCGGGGA
jgi:chromosome segregation ATPase